MDTYPDDIQLADDDAGLSYDDSVPYEEQISSNILDQRLQVDGARGLADSTGINKMYLLSDSKLTGITSRKSGPGKRKRDISESTGEVDDMQDVNMDESRPNAILLEGTPISHLSTARIFAYATHFDAKPVGLEWINDTTCVLVFDSKELAQDAYRMLESVDSNEQDEQEFVKAKSIPMTLWPPEESIDKVLRKGDGIKGDIRMRPAKTSDVKKRGAKKQSEFYRKHGEDAGKEKYGLDDAPPRIRSEEFEGFRKRQRRGDYDQEERRRELDAELEEFLAEDSDNLVDSDEKARPAREKSGSRRSGRPRIEGNTLFSRISGDILSSSDNIRRQSSLQDRIALSPSPPLSKMRSDYIDDIRAESPPLLSRMRSDFIDESPPSRMRSDYLDNDGRTLLQRTSVMRAISPDHIVQPDGRWEHVERPIKSLPRRRGGRKSERGSSRQDLDDQLDSIYNDS